MNSKNVTWLRISGVSGILAPIVAFTCIFLAIAYSPQFNWTKNALSDLGIQEGVTAILFNSGLILSGFLALVFAFGLFFLLQEKAIGRIGASIFILDTLALIAIGVFPENVKPTHYYASVAFFMLFPISMFFIVAAFLQMSEVKMGLFTLLTAVVAAVVWMIQFSIKLVPKVAIPETVSAISASVWSIFLGFKMLRQSSHSKR